jgi:beta-galactosidase/beta-glucuronidase
MRTKILLDGVWHFQIDPENIGKAQQWFLEENFQYLETLFIGIVPGCWNHYHSDLKNYNGIGWYFRNFEVPSVLSNKKIILHFDGIHGDGPEGIEVYLDGKKILTQKGAFSPFEYELTGISTEKSHFLAIRVDSLEAGGIDRSTSLQFSDWIYIDDHHVVQKLEWINDTTPKSAELTIRTFLRNDTDKEWNGHVEYLFTHQKAVISKTQRDFNIQNKNSRLLTTVIVLDKPNLWSPSNPFLYDLHIRVIDSEEHLVDEDFTSIGIREISSKDEKLLLNHKELDMNGLKIQYISEQFGSAIPIVFLMQKLENLKKEGINILYFDHLLDPRVLDLTDSYGFCIIQGADKFEMIDSHAEHLIKTMIFRDRNHASVISWVYTRELDLSRSINEELITHWISSFTCRSL